MKFRIGDKETKYLLSQGTYKIGRPDRFPRISGPGFQNGGRIIGPGNPSVSREHLEIKVSENEAILTDLGSAFGTFLNGSNSLLQQETITKAGNYKLSLAGSLDLYLEATE